MACFQSMMKSPLVSDMMTMHVMVGRQAVITLLMLVYWSDQVHSLCISYSLFLSWLCHLYEWSKTCTVWCICFFRMVFWGALKDCCILVISLEMNSAKPSAISSLFLPGGSGLWVLHPVRLFTILNNSLVFLLLSIICLVIICFCGIFSSILYLFLSVR